MPRAGAPLRALQLATLSTLVHERRTDPRVGELIAACEGDADLTADARTAANLREIRRDYDLATRLPASLVRDFAETTSLALEAWKDARERSDFAAFAPWLEKVVRLNRAKAECYGGSASGDGLYDALLDEYEPGMRTAEIERVFGALRAELTPLIAQIADAPQRPSDAPYHVELPIERQQRFNQEIAAQIGFDFGAGRLDTSTHPFCTGLGPGDTRLTTRYRGDAFPDALSSTLHEAGHGLYEQGLPKAAHWGEPLGEAASLGIHESQSRLWENMIGRSRPFWEWALPRANDAFGGALGAFSVNDMYGTMNLVQPGLIRVDADEATYNLHIMLRFDLERALLTGDLPIAELPGAWNARIAEDLGLAVPDDRRGCLQDIHWAMGSIGYFPTYTLGNLYAAQLWEAIRASIPDADEQIRAGDFAEVLGWLRRNIHQHGRRYPAPELCELATGAPLSAEPLLRYLRGRLGEVYGV
jgi:carboxypeptidase Taq